MEFFEQFRQIGIIPVVEINAIEDALPLAKALAAGGLPIVEITLRTPVALECIRIVAKQAEGVVVGAGTVLNIEQAQNALQAGAEFLVSPGLPEPVVEWARERGIPMLPGVLTPTEILKAVNLGCRVLKFFPAETAGGLKAIKAMSNPFPGIQFIPSGGIRADNLTEYLQNEKILAVAGSWMCKRQTIAAHDFGLIEQQAASASLIVKQIRG